MEVPGLGSEVQCIRQQMHEVDPLPSPKKFPKTAFPLGVTLVSVGLGQAMIMRDLAGWTAPQ
jgi:hypothetical protein